MKLVDVEQARVYPRKRVYIAAWKEHSSQTLLPDPCENTPYIVQNSKDTYQGAFFRQYSNSFIHCHPQRPRRHNLFTALNQPSQTGDLRTLKSGLDKYLPSHPHGFFSRLVRQVLSFAFPTNNPQLHPSLRWKSSFREYGASKRVRHGSGPYWTTSVFHSSRQAVHLRAYHSRMHQINWCHSSKRRSTPPLGCAVDR